MNNTWNRKTVPKGTIVFNYSSGPYFPTNPSSQKLFIKVVSTDQSTKSERIVITTRPACFDRRLTAATEIQPSSDSRLCHKTIFPTRLFSSAFSLPLSSLHLRVELMCPGNELANDFSFQTRAGYILSGNRAACRYLTRPFFVLKGSLTLLPSLLSLTRYAAATGISIRSEFFARRARPVIATWREKNFTSQAFLLFQRSALSREMFSRWVWHKVYIPVYIYARTRPFLVVRRYEKWRRDYGA